MQIFSPSRVTSYRFRKGREGVRGFTLLEMMVSVAIIALITALVLVKFGAFESTTLLKGAAYELALSIRDAQVYSISVKGNAGGFDYPYGVHFAKLGTTYTFFRDENSQSGQLFYLGGTDTPLSSPVVGRSMRIEDLCVYTTGSPNTCVPVDALDVSFRRPEFYALFYAAQGEGTSYTSEITKAQVKLKSTKGTDIWVIEIGLLGHISVFKG